MAPGNLFKPIWQHHSAAGSPASTYLVAICLAAPHVLYGFIWFFPQVWRSWFRKKSVLVFDCTAWVLKVVQFSAVTLWLFNEQSRGGQLSFQEISVLQWLLAIALAIGGQALNIGIFRAIGHNGVYYGFKLGHKIPWYDGFPFNVVSHPQYVGAVMTVWAVVILLGTQAPAGLGLIACYWTALYALTALQESYF